jgi:hypothetical protein
LEVFWNMTFKSSRIRMRYALADFLVELGIMILTTSHDKRMRMLKKGSTLACSSQRSSKLCVLSLVSCNFPFQPSMRGDLMKLCVITSLVLDRRGDPTPLIKSLLPRPLPSRSVELPKSCRECSTISQSAFLPARPSFIKEFLHRPRCKDPRVAPAPHRRL